MYSKLFRTFVVFCLIPNWYGGRVMIVPTVAGFLQLSFGGFEKFGERNLVRDGLYIYIYIYI